MIKKLDKGSNFKIHTQARVEKQLKAQMIKDGNKKTSKLLIKNQESKGTKKMRLHTQNTTQLLEVGHSLYF